MVFKSVERLTRSKVYMYSNVLEMYSIYNMTYVLKCGMHLVAYCCKKCDEICYELSHCAAKLTMLVQESTKLQDDALPLYQLVVGFKSSHQDLS